VEEMKKHVITAFLIGILIGSAIGYGYFRYCYFSVKGQEANSREAAYSYLVNSYNSTLGLCYEYPDSNTYWVSNDNVLAFYALQQWNRTIADNISETIKRIAGEYGIPASQTGIPLNYRAEILLGYNVDYFFNETEKVNLTDSYHGSKLKTEKANDSIIPDFENYADLLCYASLVEWRRQNYNESNYYYEKVKAMWDGNGFRDTVFNKTGYYATYKLGLFYFLNKMTRNGSFVFENQLIERVWQCQDSNGGFKTDYYANGSFPVCQTNTETTAIILISGIPVSLEHEENVKIGAYYYIWYGLPPPLIDHWNETIKGKPFLGKYNSNDSAIADQHILLAKQHEIDFFAVSWMGKGTWVDWINYTADHTWDFDEIDNNLQNGLLKAPHIQDFNFCLFYETQIILSTYWQKPEKNFTKIFIDDMVYASQQYFDNPSYLHIDGKPVMFIYNLPYLYLYSPVPAQELLNETKQRLTSMGSDVYFIGDVGSNCISPHEVNSSMLYSMNATTNYFFANVKASEGWSNITEYARTYYPEWRENMSSMGIKFIPNAYPGFNNSGLAGVVNSTELPNNETMFREMLTTAINYADSDLKMVMITSWNEWLESTAIEPSMERGELFIHQVYDVVPEFPSVAFLSLFMILTMIVAVYSKKRFARIKNK
jgi:glycoprotein endo-alpha-1,2-mannosidase